MDMSLQVLFTDMSAVSISQQIEDRAVILLLATKVSSWLGGLKQANTQISPVQLLSVQGSADPSHQQM